MVIELCEALDNHEATVFLNEPTYPYFMSLSVSNLHNLRLFDVRVVEMNYERVSFIIDKNSFVMIDLKEVSEQYNVKRKIVILMYMEAYTFTQERQISSLSSFFLLRPSCRFFYFCVSVIVIEPQ